MKIPDLFIQLYLVEGERECCYLEDLHWAWKVFVLETGVQEPENWLRDLVLDHEVALEQPARGKTWRGWRVQGLALNSETAKRYNRYRLERMGVGT